MAKKAYFWGIVLMLLSVVQGQAAQCPARQIDLARQFAADPASGNNARLICDQRFVRATDPASAEAERTACLLAAETVFIPAYDNVVAGGSDCQLTRPGQEISRVWGSEIDQAVAPLLAAWAQSVPGGAFTPASRNRRFASIVRAIGFATNQAFRAEAAFIRNDLTAQERDQRRVNTTSKLTRRLGNLTRNRPDYNGPTVETLVRLANPAVDSIVAMALANPGIPAPTSVVIQDGSDGVDLAEANAGVAVTVGLADDLWPGVQLNLSWGDQPPMTVGLTAADLAAASTTVVVPFATIQAQGDGPVTVSARLSHPAGATSLTLKSGTTVNVSGIPLTVRVAGSGTVTSSPPGIDCGPDSVCTASFPSNSMVDLQARPQEGWTFTGWQGNCAGTGACRVTMNRARSVVANFSTVPGVLTVNVFGSGTVSSTPAGIECGSNTTCRAEFPLGTLVSLSATPQTGWIFAGWSGDCSGTGPCTVALDQARSVIASFTALPVALNVTVNGLGTVNSNPAGIACGANTTCTANFPLDTQVMLVAAPQTGWVFAGWSGDCSGTGPCTVALDQARSVIASFTALPVALNVTVNGLGTVNSNPAGIACGANTTCRANFPLDTQVMLVAAPQTGWVFAGWSGDCSGTGPCTVALDQARSVIASFTALPVALNVTVNGLGTVNSNPAGIACGANTTCTANFPLDTQVMLVAAPQTGWVFAGWSGDCSGTGPCTVTLDRARSVSAQFSPFINLTVTVGNFGTVISSPAGINCPGPMTCSAAFPPGTVVTLQPLPDPDFFFDFWSGDCTGSGACMLTLNNDKAVSAFFTSMPPPVP